MGTVLEGDGDGWDVVTERLFACALLQSMSITCFKELSNRYQMNQYELIQLVDRLYRYLRLALFLTSSIPHPIDMVI